jgi:uncharacterized iron-regulated membrane protein
MTVRRSRTLARLHGWAGVLVALPLLLIAASGTALLYKDALFVPATWRANEASDAAAVDGQSAADAEVVRLIAMPALQRVDSIQLARGRRAFHVVEQPDGAAAYWRRGATTPSAAVPLRLRAERTVLELHEHLLLGAAGDVAVRMIGPLVAVLLGVGLVLWWPLRRGWRARDLLPRGTGRPQLLRAHLALGGALGLLFLVHATSGALMANNPSVRAWLKPFTPPQATRPPADRPLGFAPGDAVAAIAAVRVLFPGGEITQLAPTAEGTATTWSMKLRLPGEDHPNGRSNVTLDVAGGMVLALRDARLAGAPGAYDDTLFPLHTGTLLAPWQRPLWLLGGFALACAALAGALSFLRRGRGRPPA